MKKQYSLTVIVEKDESGRFLAICPALQGCYTDGETPEEALRLIEDAMKLHIEDRIENGEPVYEEVTTATVRVAV